MKYEHKAFSYYFNLNAISKKKINKNLYFENFKV